MTTVTDEHITRRMVEVTYLVHKRMTICLIELDSGFIVTGEASCVDPAHFDAGLGRTLAYARARSKLWAYFGFALAEQLLAAVGKAAPKDPFVHDPLAEPAASADDTYERQKLRMARDADWHQSLLDTSRYEGLTRASDKI